MTAHQRAVRIFQEFGEPVEPLPFGAQMFPTLARTWEGMVRKVGRRYRARRGSLTE